MKKYLYSYIWYDDPSAQQSDVQIGSILHILASEPFDKVFLWRLHDVSSQKTYRIKEARLKEIIKEQFRIPVEIMDLEKESIQQVGRWKEIFHHSIQYCLQQANDDSILWYINFSRGTPIMISSLTHAILTINHPLYAIYADDEVTPAPLKYETTKKHIVHAMQKPRTITVASIHQLQENFIKAQLIQLLDIRDYHAASLLLRAFPNSYYQTLKSMCDGAYALCNFEIEEAIQYFRYTPLQSLFANDLPYDLKRMIIYVANLQKKIDQQEYFDFVMRTSPLLYELCFTVLIDYVHFPMQAISGHDNYASHLVKKSNQHLIPTQFKGFFQSHFTKNPSAEHVVLTTPLLMHLITYQLTQVMTLVNELNELRSFEENIRNEFAHVFSDYTVQYIYEKTGKTPQNIIHLFQSVILKIAYQHLPSKEVFAIYAAIQDTLTAYLQA